MLDSHSVIGKPVSFSQHRKTRRQFFLCPTPHILDLLRSNGRHIRILFLQPRHCFSDPLTLEIEESLRNSIRYQPRHNDGHSFHRMYPDTEAPAAGIFTEDHITEFRIGEYPELFLWHINQIFCKVNYKKCKNLETTDCFIGIYTYLCAAKIRNTRLLATRIIINL